MNFLQAIMLKKILHFQIFIYLIALNLNISECCFQQRQKIILALAQDLLIKNIIIIKQPSIAKTIIPFAKSMSQLKIYISCSSSQEVQEFINSEIIFPKTMISTFEEKFNDEILELISENEKGASKFIWLIWHSENRSIKEKKALYVPYNCQLLIVENNYEKNNVCYIKEMYHPSISSHSMFERNFGTWAKNTGIVIPEKDFYKRRFEMNRTGLILKIDPVSNV